MDEVLTVSGLDAIGENSRYIVGDAGNQIYISVWAVDLEYLRQRAQLAIGFDEWDRWWQTDPDLRTFILASQAEEVSR